MTSPRIESSRIIAKPANKSDAKARDVCYDSRPMAFTTKARFSRRVADHVTDELVNVLKDGKVYEFKALFLKVYEGLKVKNAVSGGEEMLRLRAYEKLQSLTGRGLVEKSSKCYRGLKGLEQASSVHQLARVDAAVAAAAARVAVPAVA